MQQMNHTIEHALLFIFLSFVYQGISNNKYNVCDYFRALMFIIGRFTKPIVRVVEGDSCHPKIEIYL